LNILNWFPERGADMEAQEMQGGRQRTPKECEVHTSFGYFRMYLSALGEDMNRFKEVIPQASGTEVPQFTRTS
jgi:hypothetical protein